MKVQRLIGTFLSASSVLLLVTAATDAKAELEIVASAAFPESNAFGLVVNGEQNAMTVTVENKSERDATLVNIAGSLHHPETGALVKNLTASKVGVPLSTKGQLRLPYTFHSEFKPGDLRLNIWVESLVDNQKFRVEAYDSVVKIVEPEVSFFDFKMLTTYLIVIAFFGGISYYVYVTLSPQPKKSRSKAAQPNMSVSAVATGAGGYEEEWIPEHHLKKTKSGKKPSTALGGTSGEELSGTEASGAESRKRKGRK